MCDETGVVRRRKTAIKVTRRTMSLSHGSAEAKSSVITPRKTILLAACCLV
jgi:hypothetical protein